MIYHLLAVYFLSAFLMWRYVHLAYSYGGRFYRLEPDIVDLIFTLMPLVNIGACFISWLAYYPIKRERRNISFNLNKFFNIKP